MLENWRALEELTDDERKRIVMIFVRPGTAPMMGIGENAIVIHYGEKWITFSGGQVFVENENPVERVKLDLGISMN